MSQKELMATKHDGASFAEAGAPGMEYIVHLYWGVVEHVRGSVILTGTTAPEALGIGPDVDDAGVRRAGFPYVATPLQPQLDYENAEHKALLDRLLADVVASGHYTYYEWEEDDE